MRFLSLTNSKKTSGFTLIEVLIIAPIVILAISGFIALIMSVVGDVLLTRDQSVMTYENQDALDRIEQDTRISTQFLPSTRDLTAPQGKNDSTTPFTNSDGLIMGTLATDKNPNAPDRKLIYYANQPNACGANQSQNQFMINKIIYFKKNGSLWRRVVVPQNNMNAIPNTFTTCSAPWQQNSCSPGYTTSPPCQANDIEVMKNVDVFSIKFYNSPSQTTEVTGAENIKNASTVEVTLTGKKTTAGKTVGTSASVRATKLNSIDSDLPPPTSPSIAYSFKDPGVEFTWSDTNSKVTAYYVSYQVNGGGFTSTTVPATTSSFTVKAYRNDVVNMRIAAVNIAGVSPNGASDTTVPDWYDAPLINNWEYYAAPYATAGYTKTKHDIVSLKGLIKSGSTTLESVIFTLPEGYRPQYRTIFIVGSYMGGGSGYGRLDVFPNGQVRFLGGTNNWLSLDSINFRATGTATWNNLTYANGWSYFGAPYPILRASKDDGGRVFIEGMIKAGTLASGTAIAALPTGYQPTLHHIFPASDGTTIGSFGVYNNNNIVSRAMFSSYISTNAMYIPASYTGTWANLPLTSGWVYYGSPHNTAQVTKTADGMVTVKGLIKSGTITNTTNIAQLPVGYRPAERRMFPAIANQAYARMDVKPDGYISIEGGGNAGFMSLDSISFIAEQ